MAASMRQPKFSQAKFESLLKAERWDELEDLLRMLVREDPKSHWASTNLAMVCNEQRRYQEAKEWSDLAYGLAPRCPQVRWDRAGIFDNLGDTERAIAFWRSLLDTPEHEIAEDPCWESEQYTQRLLADCWYRISIACLEQWQFAESEDAEAEYRSHIAAGASSIYSIHELESELERIRTRHSGG